jgi:hypothetical protein
MPSSSTHNSNASPPLSRPQLAKAGAVAVAAALALGVWLLPGRQSPNDPDNGADTLTLGLRATQTAIVSQRPSPSPQFVATQPTSTHSPVAAETGATPTELPRVSTPSPMAGMAPAAPSASPTPSAATAVAALVAFEGSVRSGSLHATMTYADGTQLEAEVRFDLGGDARPQAFHLLSSYVAPSGSQALERIIVGERTWQRVDLGAWEESTEHSAVWDQIRAYLPHARMDADTAVALQDGQQQLSWFDSARNADVTVTVEQATGAPTELQLTMRPSGVVLLVRYLEWNQPVELVPPM